MASFGSLASKVGGAVKTGAKNMGNAMKAPAKGTGINTSPSKGFMNNMPGMVNAAAQQFGNPNMRQGVQNAGMAMGMPMGRRPMPMPGGQPPPTPTMLQMPPPSGGMVPGVQPGMDDGSGIVRGPSQMPFDMSGNTGITGGARTPMNGSMQMDPRLTAMGARSMRAPQGGNLFQNYSRMLG